jgi:hypothetical protein
MPSWIWPLLARNCTSMVIGSPLALGGLDQCRALFGVDPQAQLQGGAADRVCTGQPNRLSKYWLASLIRPSSWRVSNTMFGHRWNSVAKRFSELLRAVRADAGG